MGVSSEDMKKIIYGALASAIVLWIGSSLYSEYQDNLNRHDIASSMLDEINS